MQREVLIINGFVNNEKGGNPAGVVLNAEDLSKEQKQMIASKVGLSETAFFSNSDLSDYKVEFFTPNRQIAHCGHATIASFSYLAQIGEIQSAKSSKETVDGNRDIFIIEDKAFMEQTAPKCFVPWEKNESVNEDLILKSLNLGKEDLLENYIPRVVNTGNSFLIVAVKNEGSLKKIIPNQNLINEISEKFDLIGYYVFTFETKDENNDAAARMFAPRYGIPEESATGMAAGTLTAYLYNHSHLKKEEYFFEQGYFMEVPSPSLLHSKVELENGKIKRILVGGKGKLMKSLTVEF